MLQSICSLRSARSQVCKSEEEFYSKRSFILAGVVNAIFVFATFVTSLPALALPMNRSWLKIQGWMVVGCSFFSLILGLFIWFDTLQTQKNLMGVWTQQSMQVQSLMEQRVSCSRIIHVQANSKLV